MSDTSLKSLHLWHLDSDFMQKNHSAFCVMKIFYIAHLVSVHNVSLIPSDNKLTIREGSMKEVQCEVNRNAYPAPGFFWYVASIQIVNAFNTGYRTSVTITGNKVDNQKTLQCRATNNNNPPKTATTTLNIECKNILKLFYNLVHKHHRKYYNFFSLPRWAQVIPA